MGGGGTSLSLNVFFLILKNNFPSARFTVLRFMNSLPGLFTVPLGQLWYHSLKRVVREFHPKAKSEDFIPVVYVNFPSARFTVLRFMNSLPGLFTVSLTRMTDLLSRLNNFLIIVLCCIKF